MTLKLRKYRRGTLAIIKLVRCPRKKNNISLNECLACEFHNGLRTDLKDYTKIGCEYYEKMEK